MSESNGAFADPRFLDDPRVFGSVGLDRLGAKPLRAMDPRRVGPYAVLALLGGGGMGRIYLGRPVDGSSGLAAVKVIRPEYAEDEAFRRRFERESAALARVRGEQAAVLLGSGYDGDLLWMATEYIPGPSLSEAVAASGPTGPAAAWRIALELAQAVSAMERVGVVHRDIKPSNIILGPAGCRVIDFGISQAADTSSITTTGQQVGTPAYMSPEQVRGQTVASSSDLFALGSVLAFALTGHGPFGDGTTVDVLHRVAFEEPKEEVLGEVEAIDPVLAELVRACLDKNPDARPSAADVGDRAASHQVAAPWSAELSAAVMSRVEVAAAVQSLPLPSADAPVADDGTMLLGRGGTGAPLAAAAPHTPPTAPAPVPVEARVRQTPPTVPVVGAQPHQAAAPYALPAYVSVGPAAASAAPGADEEPRRGRRGVLLAVAAVLAVAALTGTAVALTGGGSGPHTVASQQGGGSGDGVAVSPSGDASGPAPASGTPSAASATGSAAPSAAGHTPSAAAQPGTSASAPAGTGGTATSGTTQAPGGGTTGSRPTTPAPAQSTPSTPHTTPAAPPPPAQPIWDQNCTYYSGSAETDPGMTGAAVREIQCLLTYRGYSVGSSGIDGQFGPDTKAAVIAFQRHMGLSADGGVGPQTWPALRSSTP